MKRAIHTAALLLAVVTLAHAQDDKKTPEKSRSVKSDTLITTSQPRPLRIEKNENPGKTKSPQNTGTPQPVRSTVTKKE